MYIFESEEKLGDFLEMEFFNFRCPLKKCIFDSYQREYRIGGYGYADFITVKILKSKIKITVYELKKDGLKPKHIGQISQYMKGVKRMMQEQYEGDKKIIVDGVFLVKEDYSDNVLYLFDHVKDIRCFVYSFNYKGIRYKEATDIVLVDEKFSGEELNKIREDINVD